ncbi:MAG: DUF4158 domain-containing protein [Kamptonema sp. SIO1D9]|nr:DUF4158 domain-containing protein [Kamptonema sp. SIO1D9]
MPGQFLSQTERERLQSFPLEITSNEVITFFTLSDKDLTLTKKRSGDHNLLGFALQLGTLRYLSFIPDNFPQLPSVVE